MTKEFIDSMLAGDDAVNAYGRLVSLAIGLASNSAISDQLATPKSHSCTVVTPTML